MVTARVPSGPGLFLAPRTRGTSLVELAVSVTLLVGGVLAVGFTMVTLDRNATRTRELGRATAAATEILERIQAEAFPEAFRRFNATGDDDPGGIGTAPGAAFAVEGLTARPDDLDGLPGEILFPSPADAPNELRESFEDEAMGMPSDLNGDGVVHATASYATAYELLPVRIRVTWVGVSGPAEYELRTVLGNYR